MTNSKTLHVTQRERQAARAFRAGDTLAEIAAILGTSETDADAWLESPRLDEVCQAMRKTDKPRRGRPRKHNK